MTLASLIWRLSYRAGKWARRYSWRNLTAPQLFVCSFAALILLGTLGLKTLPGLYTGAPLGWLDAAFTAASAVCVTGLIVADTATVFTPLGQGFVLVLIQLGGLGILTFATLIVLAIGGRLPAANELLSRSVSEFSPNLDYRRVTRDMVVFTFLFEMGGAILLYLCWGGRLGWAEAWWPALFHSVSAFCNAGFSTFSDSLVRFADSPATLLVIMTLIVVGGIGFVTMEELAAWRRARRQGRAFRFSLHTRLVLVTTAILLVVGWVALAALEWQRTLGGMPWLDRVVNGLFMSVTARTAGFNTVDYAQTNISTNFLTILLMSIGGSPGSIAGGLKTTTLALIVLLAWSRLRGYELTTLAGCSVPTETTQRAVGLFVMMFALVTVAVFVFTSTEMVSGTPVTEKFLEMMFEAVSAFNTVGLSMGMTGQLSETGKVVTIGLMFLGRVGPLTFAAALARRRQVLAREFRYAYEDVAVG